ncbi:MAG: c-type cytochrome [Vibrio sp.]
MKQAWLLITGIVFSFTANAADIEAGQAKAAVCAACHGADGMAILPTYPNLKGQNAPYLEKQLNAFRSGERNDPLMTPMAKPLSDEDVKNLAAYYQSLK